jgi:DNA (cytosine-5)-methyltransferase 1
MGYHRAGFDVVGVDIAPQPHYPFEFVQGDAIEFMAEEALMPGFDVYHASPPCQAYSSGAKAAGTTDQHPDLYAMTRNLLVAIGRPYIIENVIGAPYSHGFVLCGSMFDLRVQRHRNFEASEMLLLPFVCDHTGERPFTITGKGDTNAGDYHHSRHPAKADGPDIMGMPWATWDEVKLAIPPAYTEWIGRQLLAAIEAVA